MLPFSRVSVFTNLLGRLRGTDPGRPVNLGKGSCRPSSHTWVTVLVPPKPTRVRSRYGTETLVPHNQSNPRILFYDVWPTEFDVFKQKKVKTSDSLVSRPTETRTTPEKKSEPLPVEERHRSVTSSSLSLAHERETTEKIIHTIRIVLSRGGVLD